MHALALACCALPEHPAWCTESGSRPGSCVYRRRIFPPSGCRAREVQTCNLMTVSQRRTCTLHRRKERVEKYLALLTTSFRCFLTPPARLFAHRCLQLMTADAQQGQAQQHMARRRGAPQKAIKCITCSKKSRPCGFACPKWPGHGTLDRAVDGGETSQAHGVAQGFGGELTPRQHGGAASVPLGSTSTADVATLELLTQIS